MNIPKHVLNCPLVGQQHDILSFCEHLILILRLSSILSKNDNSEYGRYNLPTQFYDFYRMLRKLSTLIMPYIMIHSLLNKSNTL